MKSTMVQDTPTDSSEMPYLSSAQLMSIVDM